MELELLPRQTKDAGVRETERGRWRMEVPAGPAGTYRWAQLDDHLHRSRAVFPWQPPLQLALRARVSAPDLPGTWGFGFWNDSFSVSLGLGGTARRLPALPNTAWFFHAGLPNHLAFRDTHPAQGFLAATFSSPALPSLLLAPAALAVPLLALPPAARLLRRAARLLIQEEAVQVTGNPTIWRDYRLEWTAQEVRFLVDGSEILATPVSPRSRLGLVIWIDNQFAAFPPSGRVRVGTSANPAPAWLEVEGITVSAG